MSRITPVIDRYAAGGPLLVYATSGLTREREPPARAPGAGVSRSSRLTCSTPTS